jgi:hypothetical protein
VLANVEGLDHEVLRKAFSGSGECVTSRCLKELSTAFKDDLLAIGGPESASLLAIQPNSCSIPFLDLNTLVMDQSNFLFGTSRSCPDGLKGNGAKLSMAIVS